MTPALVAHGRQRRRHRLRQVGRLGLDSLRQAEIEHLHLVVGGDLDVGRLEVAMDDSCFVRFLERLRNLPGNGERFGERDRAPPNPLLQGLAGHEFHHQEVAAVRFFDAVDRGDVWMIQRGQHARFALEPGNPVAVMAEGFREELDRDRASELRVGGLIDLAHAARAEVRCDFVVCEACSDHVGGVHNTADQEQFERFTPITRWRFIRGSSTFSRLERSDIHHAVIESVASDGPRGRRFPLPVVGAPGGSDRPGSDAGVDRPAGLRS